MVLWENIVIQAPKVLPGYLCHPYMDSSQAGVIVYVPMRKLRHRVV
jgi:hypothetical protein